jgi:ATP-dependent helicase/nuclease subunit A
LSAAPKSDRGDLLVPADTVFSQHRAADPAYSIWVEANAGSGKTFVLTRRVLRLLLAKVQPETILCLTYTKTAAAEMRDRVASELAQWALMDDAALAKALEKIEGVAPDPARIGFARTLFARALETPGGLRIVTIHAFCESVLHRFPIEAGVPFDFSVIEDEDRAAMVLAAREAVLSGGLRGDGPAEAVETLFGLMSDHQIATAIDAALGEGAKLKIVLADRAGAPRRLRSLLGLGDRTLVDIEAEMLTLACLARNDCTEIVQTLGARAGGRTFASYLVGFDPEAPDVDALCSAFFTEKGAPRALMNQTQAKAHPELFARFSAEQDRLAALLDLRVAAQLAQRSDAFLAVIGAILDRYETIKRARSLLDFDDLIERLSALLADQAIGPWVRYKLDAGIDHILVDESQDTNPEQWRVVRALADAYFEGSGAVTRPRSLFAVGDQKQSIYSFQGAEPKLFAETGRTFAQRAAAADIAFDQRRLHTSFRTLGGILSAVDTVFEAPDLQAAVLASEKPIHQAARTMAGGTVTLWPPVQAIAARDQAGAWPLEPQSAEQGAERQVAERIAGAIAGWIASGRTLGARARAVRADDILILVQKRGVLFQEMIRALRREDLPTPGPDRLAVTTHIATLDLLALCDVLLNPADDLQLAALLRSPLFDLSEQDLYALAHGRKGQTLWSVLGASRDLFAAEAASKLRRWRSQLDLERPFEFLTSVLYAGGGLKRFHERLGSEVDDVLAELLDLALAHEQSDTPSLQGFVAAVRARAIAIKRELTGGGVRVMTVHGAKGLEAPIVILADAATSPQPSQLTRQIHLLTDAPKGPLLVHASRSGDHTPHTLFLRQEIEANLKAEYWRRLYVAMTRAEDELYITGPLTPGSDAGRQIEASWYGAIERALRPVSRSVADGEGVETALVYPATEPGAAASASVAETPSMPVTSSPVLFKPISTPIVPARLAPSRAGVGAADGLALAPLAETVRDAETARREGITLHALLQHLWRFDPAERSRIGLSASAALLPEAPNRHAALVEQAIAILEDPALLRIFGPHSRAEVPFQTRMKQHGEPVTITGRIDRLVVDGEGVLVVDYKSDAVSPDNPDAVPGPYRTQLGLYALVAGQLFPEAEVRAAILWTSLKTLMFLPQASLARATEDFTMR